MTTKALMDYTYTSRYARYNKEEKRRETWEEAVNRVKQMHLKKYPQVKEEIEWAFQQVLEKKVLGSQRALQFGGTPIERINERMYNCAFAYADRIRFFQEAFFLLLAGSGVGFSVQKHHVAKLPKISEDAIKRYTSLLINQPIKVKTYTIPDSIEGWADSLGVLLSSYFNNPQFPEYKDYQVRFDFSEIRPKGSPLSSGVGRAPGPEPLKNALYNIKKLLDKRISEGHKSLRPIDVYDIIMHSADAVLSGGVRRSATIALFSHDDEEMLNSKTGNWYYENPQRGRSNNSALLLRDETTFEQFEKIMETVKEYGEPGFVWADSLESGFNPCVEINLYAYDFLGRSGWQVCNLTEVNGKLIKTRKDFENAARAAAIIGTLQAGYTDFKYLGEVSRLITEKEALLGVSITGMMENDEVIFNPDTQREMAELIKQVNKEMAKKININPAARCTCVKPAGSTSCVLGTSSGIHPHHSHRYFRRVQSNNAEATLQFYKAYNPLAVEDSVWSANKTDGVITFCIEVNPKAITKKQVNAIDLLEKVKLTQKNWVAAGTNQELCVQPWLRHNVSNTIHVQQNEWESVTKFIYENREFFAGIALLPASGDLDYPQAPFCHVSDEKEIVEKYGIGSIFASGLIVDGLHVFNDNLWQACDAVIGKGKGKGKGNGLDNTQKDWVRRAKQFAFRYFENDITRMLYCLKETNNWKLWNDLKREYIEVDYTLLCEEEDETNPLVELACASGACLI